MTTPNNPASPLLTDTDWQRLSNDTQEYVAASFELMTKAHGYLRDGDLRQASEKGWGSAAQILKAVAENWKDAGVTHGRHQDLRALVHGLASLNNESDLDTGFYAAQDLHENFYENDAPEYIVTLNLRRTEQFCGVMLPWLRRPRPPQGFRQGR
ncbi:MAG: hypothetical protein OXI54_00975 [Chloroflexota bacterium]|nr:hypothetical protein [Chloroflexota bacterium]MDE2682710.1 hypothetical protein [Chloroflexota bacterium]